MKAVARIIRLVLLVLGTLMIFSAFTLFSKSEITSGAFSIALGVVSIALGFRIMKKKKTTENKSAEEEKEEVNEDAIPSTNDTMGINSIKSSQIAVYSFRVSGISRHEEEIIEKLMYENPDYDLNKSDIIEQGLEDERIYRYADGSNKTELIPEPENPRDANAIKVVVDNIHIGYVPVEKTEKVHKLLSSGRIRSITCELIGGPYKILEESYDDSRGEEVYEIRKEKWNIGAKIEIKYMTLK